MKNLLRSAASLVLLSASSAGAIEIVGLTTTGDLVRFQRNTPGTITTVAVTNLPDGMTLYTIDQNRISKSLYGIAAQGTDLQLWEIDPDTGAASPNGGASPAPGIATATRFAFETDADYPITVYTDAASDGPGGNENILVKPLITWEPSGSEQSFASLPTGSAAGPILDFAVFPFELGVLHLLHGSQSLAHSGLSPFNALQPIGPLGVAFSTNAGLDAIPDTGLLAILEVGGSSGLYSVDPGSGTATFLGTIGDGTLDFRSMAILYPGPEVQLAADAFAADEADKSADVSFYCATCAYGAATFDWRTVDGTARAGVDYFPASGTVTIPLEAADATVTIQLIDDDVRRRGRAFAVEITAVADGTTLVTPDRATVAIADDDGLPIAVVQARVKAGSLAALAAKGSFAMPRGEAEDPSLQGGSLLFSRASGEALYTLDAAGWEPIGADPASGWRYRDDACRVTLKPKQIAATCKGATGTFATSDDPVDLVLAVGSLRYCGQCGGRAVGNPAKGWKRKACEAPDACPTLD